jgi:peroxiredoxin
MLETGTTAPPFALPGESGMTDLTDLTSDKPALLAFFKTTCGTCKISFPIWGELARRHGGAVNMVAIGQDPLDQSQAFADQWGWDAPVLEDASSGYATSAAYAIPSVPTLYLIGTDGSITHATTGWDRVTANEWNSRLAEISGGSPDPVSTENDGLPDFKPG